MKNQFPIPQSLWNAIVLLSASLAIYFDYSGEQLLFRIFKPLTTILIILLPVFYAAKEPPKYMRYTLIALVFCLIGDVFLLDSDYFIGGLIAFLIGHIFFSLSFLSLYNLKFYRIPIAMLSLIGVSYYLFLASHLQTLKVPVLVYFCVIIFMCWQGYNLYLGKRNRATSLIALGVSLFLFSDAVIAWNKFYEAFYLAGGMILVTYWLSIALLANASCLMGKKEKESQAVFSK